MTQSPQSRLLHLNPNDNVAVLLRTTRSGALIPFKGQKLMLKSDVEAGHKVAVSMIGSGSKVYKNGYPIGSATRTIKPGEHVHLYNLKSDYLPTFTPDQNEFSR